MTTPKPQTASSGIRKQLAHLLDWKEAHAGFDAAVSGIPPELRGVQPHGLPYSAWQLLEHMRMAQRDILDFCVKQDYQEMKWPDDYWPKSPAPPSEAAWDRAIEQFRADREELKKLAGNTRIDLEARIPHGNGQTYLREIVLVADHNAYHVGQLVLVRRLLGAWK